MFVIQATVASIKKFMRDKIVIDQGPLTEGGGSAQ
jgi:hypothetical protein